MSSVFFQSMPYQGATVQIESQWLNLQADPGRPLIVFLHEGLGSLSQWRDFPEQLCKAAQCRGLVFSRPGYGRSSPRTEPWPQDYLQQQTRELLPTYFDALGLRDERLFLFGQSDGASLALLFAAYFSERVCGVVAMAPHLFVEPITLTGLHAAKKAYEEGRVLKAALARHHADTDSAFYGWNNAWLRPGYEAWNIEADLKTLSCPVLAVQGVGDEYATLEQIHAIKRIWPATQLCELTDCCHSPQRDQPQKVLQETTAFLNTL